MVTILDKEGYDTLRVISDADNFNKWMFDTLRPYIRGKVLEVGSGIGNISGLLLQTQDSVVLSDLSEDYTTILRRRFTGHPALCDTLVMDLNDPAFGRRYASWAGSFDTIVALNVIEHVADDQRAIANCVGLLKKGGRLIVLVPAYQALYNRFDRELGHCRRYKKATLRELVGPHCTIIKTRYFNLAGIAGWVFSGNILRKKIIPEGQMKLFNRLVPFFKWMDRMSFRRWGLSVWAVAVKE